MATGSYEAGSIRSPLSVRRVLSTLLPAAVALGGCGGDAPARAQHNIAALTITDYRLHPQELRAKRGLITFRVRNAGRVPHAFAVAGARGIRVQISTMLPGESGTQTVRLRPGEWRMYCPLGNHEELGLYGSLEVR